MEPQTLGEHARRRRMNLRLTQAQAATAIGVDLKTVYGWERGRTQTATRHVPGILCFLGGDPQPQSEDLSARIRAAREALGLSQRALAARLGVDPSTVWSWEQARAEPPIRSDRLSWNWCGRTWLVRRGRPGRASGPTAAPTG